MKERILRILPEVISRIPLALLVALVLVMVVYSNLSQHAADRERQKLAEAANAFLEEQKSDSTKRGRSTSLDSTARISRPIAQVNVSEKLKAEVTKRNAQSFPFAVYGVICIGICIVIYVYFDARRKQRIQEIIRDRDPAQLRSLFEEHFKKILLLGTPRRVKRFSNRLRFQYNQMKLAKIIDDSTSSKFFRDAITAEANREWYLLSYTEFIKKNEFESDETVLKKLYEFNANVLV